MKITTAFNVGDIVTMNENAFPENNDYDGTLSAEELPEWKDVVGEIIGIFAHADTETAEVVYRVGFKVPEWRVYTLNENCIELV